MQVPGIQDTARLKELIGKLAVLEFRLVAEGEKSGETVTLQGQEREPLSGKMQRVPYTLEKKVLMTGDVVADARLRPSSALEGPYVELVLNDRGARRFEQITGDNVGRRMAIILDNTVYSAPTIRERIGGGRASITGDGQARARARTRARDRGAAARGDAGVSGRSSRAW